VNRAGEEGGPMGDWGTWRTSRDTTSLYTNMRRAALGGPGGGNDGADLGGASSSLQTGSFFTGSVDIVLLGG